MSKRRPAPIDQADANLAEMLDSLGGADNYLDFLFEIFRPNLTAPILEVGAGHGELTERLAAIGVVHATDISDRCLANLHDLFDQRADVSVEYLDISAPIPASSPAATAEFGSAILVNVLEHIPDDVAALTRLRAVLQPGSPVVVFVPAFDFLYGRFDRLIGHQRRYRAKSLRSAFVAAGLEPVETRYVNMPGWFAWLLTVRVLGQLPTSQRLVKIFDRIIVPMIRFSESRIRPPFGQSVIGVARTPTEPA